MQRRFGKYLFVIHTEQLLFVYTNNVPYFVARETWPFVHMAKSHNHPMFSSVEVWLMQSVAGIQPHPAAIGMDRVLVKPKPPSQVSRVSASFETPRGIISLSWSRQSSVFGGSTLDLNVTIPPNVRGTVFVPAELSSELRHNGFFGSTSSWEPSFLNNSFGSYRIDVGSGRHEFKSILATSSLKVA